MVSARIIKLFYLLVINQANNDFSIFFFSHNFRFIVDHMSNKIYPSILFETCMSFVKMLVSCVMMRLLYNSTEQNFCKPNPCSIHAKCVETQDSFKCICEEGYKGEKCNGK